MRISVEIAPGEVLDKLSILEIKSERIQDAENLRFVHAERDSLMASCVRTIPRSPELDALSRQLKEVNAALWDVEDRLRTLERNGDFGEEFVRLARSVYRTNDRRAAIKREINLLLKSDIAEAKSYEAY